MSGLAVVGSAWVTVHQPRLCARHAPATSSKFWSILLSVMRSPRPIEVFQWVGIIAVFSGLGLEIYEKYSKQMAAKQRAKLAATKKDA